MNNSMPAKVAKRLAQMTPLPEVLIKLKRKSTCSLPDPSTAREKLKKVSPPPEALLREFLV